MARPAAKTTPKTAGAKPGSAMTFAHLASVSARASDDDDDGEGDGDPKDKKDAKADGDDTPDKKDEDDGKGAKGSKAEGDKDDPKDDDADKDDPKDDDADKDKGAKSAKADDDSDPDAEDDDKDEEMRGNSAAAAARQRERARCAAIFGSKHAEGRAPLAAHFAFNTTMSRTEAIAALAATPKTAQPGARAAHPGRSDRNPSVSGQGAPALSGQKAIDASWAAAREANEKTYGRRP
jgi:hypothetical protein